MIKKQYYCIKLNNNKLKYHNNVKCIISNQINIKYLYIQNKCQTN